MPVTMNPNINNGGSIVNPDPNAVSAELLLKTAVALTNNSTITSSKDVLSNDLDKKILGLKASGDPDKNGNPIGKGPAAPTSVPSNGTAASSVGSWISAPYATAMFMALTEFASAMKEVAFLSNKIKLLQNSLVLTLGQSAAAQILEAGKKESGMYIASAISSMAEGAVALASAGIAKKGQDRAEGQGNKSLKTKETAASDAKKDVDTAKSDLKKAETKTSEMQIKQSEAKANLKAARKNADAAKKNHDTAKSGEKNEAKAQQNQAERAQKDAERKFDAAIDNTRTAKHDQMEAKTKVDDTTAQYKKRQHELDSFNLSEYTQNVAQQKTLQLTQSLTAFGKFTDGIANLMKAALVLQKSQAEALSKIIDSQSQIASRGIDNAAEQEKAAHDMIAQLFQALQKYSDDANKLVSTITAQRGA